VCLGCVVRVESIGQDPTMSLWGTSCWRGDLGIPYESYLWRVYVRGGPGCWLSLVEVLSWHKELVIPFEKISYPIPLKTGMS
jgi:hypothetical protein